MNGYPIILDLDGRLGVVVGGGPVGCRKARGLLAAGARVRMVSIALPAASFPADRLELRLKPFSVEDLDGAFLAFAATGCPDIDARVLAAARARGIMVNLAAKRAGGDFLLPAVVRRGDLLLSVATSGKAPALSRALRRQLEQAFGPEWAALVRIAAALRSINLTGDPDKPYSCEVLEKMLADGLAQLVAEGRTDAIDRLLTRNLGRQTTLAQLGLCLRDETP